MPFQVTDIDDAKERLQEMECRMLQRGYSVQPINGPSFCYIDKAENLQKLNQVMAFKMLNIDENFSLVLSLIFIFALIPFCVLVFGRSSAKLLIKNLPVFGEKQ